MRERIAALVCLLWLAACSGVAQYSADCTGDELVGVDCTGLSIHPYTPPTPYPVTMGRITLGDSWQQYTDPNTTITWAIVSAAGPVELANYNQYIVVAVTVPGDYGFEAAWQHDGIDYRAPFTLTVSVP